MIDALDGVYMGSGQIRYGKVGFLYNAVYLKVSSAREFGGERGGSVQTSRPGIGPIGGRDLTLTAAGRVDGIVDAAFSLSTTTLAGTYRAYETPKSHVDIVAGARIADVDLKIGVVADISVAVQANLSIGPSSKSFGATAGRQVNAVARDGDTWVDTIIGVSGRTQLDQHLFATGWAMIGGFGVSSDFLYDVMGGVGYDWDNGVSAFAGYRIADTDYSEGDFEWNVAKHGPLMGLGVKF